MVSSLRTIWKYIADVYSLEFLIWQLIRHFFGWRRALGGFPGGIAGKESVCNEGDPGLIPGSGRSPEEGNGYPLQYSQAENSMNTGA